MKRNSLGKRRKKKGKKRNNFFFEGDAMSSYKCAKCGEKITNLPPGIIRCPSCAHKVLYKMRDTVAKEVKAK